MSAEIPFSVSRSEWSFAVAPDASNEDTLLDSVVMMEDNNNLCSRTKSLPIKAFPLLNELPSPPSRSENASSTT